MRAMYPTPISQSPKKLPINEALLDTATRAEVKQVQRARLSMSAKSERYHSKGTRDIVVRFARANRYPEVTPAEENKGQGEIAEQRCQNNVCTFNESRSELAVQQGKN